MSLSAVASIDQLHGYAFIVLAPEIGRRLELSTSGLSLVVVGRSVAFAAAAAALGALARRGRAGAVARAGATVRAGALAVGGVATTATVAGAMFAYGGVSATIAAAHPRLLPADQREAHRLSGRVGNAVMPLTVAALAAVMSWTSVFLVLAVIAAMAALSMSGTSTVDFGPDEADNALERLLKVPGGRVALIAVTAAAVAEVPIYVVVFTHLGDQLHMTIAGRALMIAVGETVGVVANLAMGRRLRGVGDRSPVALAVAFAVTVMAGLGAMVLAMSVSSVAVAIAALCFGTVASSVVVPFMALATRAVLADAVPKWATFGAAAAIGGGLVFGPSGDAAMVATLAVLPALAALAVARVGLLSPDAASAALRSVAKVTPEPRIVPAPAALDQV